MQEDLTIRPGLVLPGSELAVQASVGGGPGGQHVNKSATRITLRWSIPNSSVLRPWQREQLLERLSSRLTTEGELVIHVHQHRSQQRNLDTARDRLATLVRDSLQVQKKRRPTKPTRSSKKKRVDAKKRRSQVKQNRGRVKSYD